MKQFLLCSLLIAGASGFVQAQTVRVGVRAGLNVASAGLQDADGIRSILASTSGSAVKTAIVAGYHAGILVSIGGPKFSLQPEVLYSQYHIRYDGGPDPSGGTNVADVKTNTVEVPILVKYAFSSHNIRFFVNAGPYVNYALNGKLNISTGYYYFPESVRFDPKSNRLAYGLTGGAGVTLPLGPGELLLEARYNYAIRSRISQFNDTNDHIRLGMLSVGYLMPLRFGK